MADVDQSGSQVTELRNLKQVFDKKPRAALKQTTRTNSRGVWLAGPCQSTLWKTCSGGRMGMLRDIPGHFIGFFHAFRTHRTLTTRMPLLHSFVHRIFPSMFN
ncbi:hypothetical protein CBL_09327 [Carabus blaptoides fortunei]